MECAMLLGVQNNQIQSSKQGAGVALGIMACAVVVVEGRPAAMGRFHQLAGVIDMKKLPALNTKILKRFCVVIFSLWVVASCIFVWFGIAKTARYTAESDRSSCDYSNKANHTNNDCWEVYKKAYETQKFQELNDLENWGALASVIFGPVVFILVIWVLCIIIIKTYYWIKTGVAFVPDGRKKYAVMTSVIFVLFLTFIAAAVIYDSYKKKAFGLAVAECKLSKITTNITADSSIEYMVSCMKTKGYSFLRGLSWCKEDDFDVEYFDCYK